MQYTCKECSRKVGTIRNSESGVFECPHCNARTYFAGHKQTTMRVYDASQITISIGGVVLDIDSACVEYQGR